MDNGNKEPTARLKILEGINAALANIESAQKRVNSAKSELGTAEAELRKWQEEYERQRSRLLERLPTFPDSGTRDFHQKLVGDPIFCSGKTVQIGQ